MEKREAFIQAVSKELVEEFLQFLQLDKDSSNPFSLSELLDELSRKQKEELWQRLKDLLTETLLESPVDRWQTVEVEGADDMESEHSPKMRKSIKIICAIVTVILASVSIINEHENYGALLECAVILNGILYALPESEQKLQNSIQDLCVKWWERGLPAKEDMGKTAFIMLLRRSLETKSGADVCRLWRIHQALYCFDYDWEESREIKDMLLECFINVNYIKKEEGRRFLSFLFSWNVDFIKMIHETIKNQLAGLQKSLMVHIAEIYFRAWKKASGKMLETIEYDCIQDFMFHGIHLLRRSPVHSKVREVLSYFHQQKVRQGVEEMLYRLYKPILWRGLKARNSEVRSNAALLFVEAFPIRDPNFTATEMDNEIQKQFEELYNLIEDPYPRVRSTGILGVCKISSKYWEMMPPNILVDFLKKVTGELAFDISSADVRCSVFKCLPIILDNKLSHPLLEQLLPTLRYSLHDNSEKVRVAFVDLLLKIKAVRAAKFWKICPMEDILVRLEMDSRPVSRRLVSLIFNSFLPVNQPEEVWCERCVTLIQMNRAAARRFYQYAHEHTASTNIAKLIHVIRHCLNACIQRTLREGSEAHKECEKENASVLDKTLSVNDTASMAGLLEIIVILWKNIHRSLENNKEAKIYTINKFAAVLPEYLKVFKDERCKIPLFMLMSFLPASAVPVFSCGVISVLRNQESVTGRSYCTLLDCLCSWGQVGHVLELIVDWLPTVPPQAKSNLASKRKVEINDTCSVKPELALLYMEYLLTHPKNRECLLSVPQKKLNQLLKALEGSKAELESFLQSPSGNPLNFNKATALHAFGLYCRMSVHLQYKFCSEEKIHLSILDDTGSWLENKVLPLLEDQEEEYLKLRKDVYQQIIQTYLAVCKDVVMVGLGDPKFQMQLLQRSFGIMKTVKGFFYVSLLLGILKEIAGNTIIHKTDSDEKVTVLFDLVQEVFQKMLECIACIFRKQPEESLPLFHSVQTPLHEFITTIQSWHKDTAVHHAVLSTLIAAPVVEISHQLQKVSDIEELTSPQCLHDLPPFSRCLVGVIMKSSDVVRSFVDELKACVTSGDVEGIVCLTAVLHIILVINKGKHISAKVKEVATAVYRKLKTFMEITLEEDSLERFLYESSMRTLGEFLNP
ncbi:condensin-2 complex subunit G2 isoform X1 [Mus musculus]|uniref:Condensin-2 complex subunit G2 n=6 Tax=Mus musculus TaxID=10090 RepID=CNDG2_MOUSE|nr:condensin-2 complex subunit G2 [Mus musculus]XP_006516413.1 condensin-2 complex subunit G2 isoform X1 [Mus musculus]XP_006516414.1 condensin-2 complex subunit G2 isoform X1 [Mus musculus]XP_006516415.1 condensin-2 complex subunit G2 isoform X1 [Mus musculus]XP_006516416.1 condensin-2 complex subunit G2 isoform X1 [Mus musculus]XP_006516417.1 condensin-2 complex subunit G2 isoform X1 [Mus musculus]XP_036013545.1 condensin-2 complex subunit G2 isoform X1 [Mus musculus]Q6DFV1.2 RecName: Full|eukprot:NP_598523.3 condensin-2 complex subunit G2 [Mus musculus]